AGGTICSAAPSEEDERGELSRSADDDGRTSEIAGVSYICNMDTNQYIARARAAGESAKLRRARAYRAEVRAVCSAGTMVLTGLMLAVLYCLLKHQIQIS